MWGVIFVLDCITNLIICSALLLKILRITFVGRRLTWNNLLILTIEVPFVCVGFPNIVNYFVGVEESCRYANPFRQILCQSIEIYANCLC